MSEKIPVFQPCRLREEGVLPQIRALEPDLIVVAAYGQILPPELLECPRLGCVNVHASLLPKYRGAAPINWAILRGEEETGVTIMYMAEKLDAGDIISQEKTPIGPEETAQELYGRLAELGADLLIKTLPQLETGSTHRTPQEAAQVSFAPMLSRELSPISWSDPARKIHDQIRGLLPWPAATAQLPGGTSVKLFRSQLTGQHSQAPAGTIAAAGKEGIDFVCGDGEILRLTELQAGGGKRMRAADYLRGHPITIQ